MAGSCLPVTDRTPNFEHELGAQIGEAISVGFIHSYKTGLDSYGLHALEVLQCMIERRTGGETGIAAVQCLEGKEVWVAGDDGMWSRELHWPVASPRKRDGWKKLSQPCCLPA